jgi:pilin isopeptide linkage protein
MKNSAGQFVQVYNEYYSGNWTRSYDLYGDRNYDRYRWFTGQNGSGTRIIPRTSGTDTNDSHTQLYVRREPTRMDALKEGVNGFIDTIAELNSGLPAEYQNRIGIVKFASTQSNTPGNTLADTNNHYNNSQIFSGLNYYTNENKQGIKDQVALNLSSGGATQANFGMNLAQTVLNGANRPEAQRVVIFFTDGEPTSGSNFEAAVANAAVSTSRTLKSNTTNPTIVYTIGVLNGASSADPTPQTSNVNLYMHALSSNYPNASGYAYNNLGARAEGSDYYLTAGGDTSLVDVFSRIASAITSSGGDATATGRDGNTALTITDQLGPYMEVKGIDGIIYKNNGANSRVTGEYALYAQTGNQGAECISVTFQRDDNGNESTYKAVGSNTVVPSSLLSGGNANLTDITVVVTRSSDPAVGDTVKVTIPPQLVPAIRYEVEQQTNGLTGESKVSSVTKTDVNPIQVLFSVGMKSSTENNVVAELQEQALRAESATNQSDSQTQAYKDFIADAAQDGADGLYKLYSNNNDNNNASVDMLVATSNPYFFFVDEPLYTRSGNPGNYTYTRATATSTGPFYYLDPVYTVGNTTPTTTPTLWSGDTAHQYKRTSDTTLDGSKTYYTLDEDGNYVEVTSPNVDDIDTYYEDTGNLIIPNGTQRTTVRPIADVNKGTGNVTDSVETVFRAPVTLDQRDDGYHANQYLGNNGRLDMPIYGTLSVTKNFTAGEGFTLPTDPAPESTFNVTFTLPDGTSATNFKALIRNSSGRPVDRDTHEPIAGNVPASTVMFDIPAAGGTFKLRDGETIKITDLPDGTTYAVAEEGQTGYQATVTNDDGTTRTFDKGDTSSTKDADASEGVSTIAMADTKSVTFDNEFTPDPVDYAIPTGLFTKSIETIENYDLTADKYTFRVYERESFDSTTRTGTLVATGTNYKDDYDAITGQDLPGTNLVADTHWTNVWEDADGTQIDTPEEGTEPTADAHPRFWFERPGTYTYYVLEEAGTEPGVSYTDTMYTLRVVVTSENGELVARPYYYLGTTQVYPVVDPETGDTDDTLARQANFVNIYAPNGVTSSPTEDPDQIKITKTLTGRSMAEGEFTYTMYTEANWDTATNAPKIIDGAPAAPSARGFSGTPSRDESTGAYTAPVTINEVPFNRSGDYVYYLAEVSPASSTNGVTYDKDVYKLTAHVTASGDTFDVVWTLDPAEAKTDNDDYKDSIDANGAGTIYYNNVYAPRDAQAEFQPSLTKGLIGRDWLAGANGETFQLTVSGPADSPKPVFSNQAGVVSAELTKDDSTGWTMTYTLQPNDGTDSVTFIPGVFTYTGSIFENSEEEQIDIGGITITGKKREFSYTVKEIIPTEADEGNTLDGVTYDSHSMTLNVTAIDDLEGNIVLSTSNTGSAAFTNEYNAELTVNPVTISKTLIDHKLEAGTFYQYIIPSNAAAKAKAGVSDYSNSSHGDAAAGVASQFTQLGPLQNIHFDQDDLADVTTAADGTRRKEFIYDVSEVIDRGRTEYDTESQQANRTRRVTITLIDDGKGNLSTSTTIAGTDGTTPDDTPPARHLRRDAPQRRPRQLHECLRGFRRAAARHLQDAQRPRCPRERVRVHAHAGQGQRRGDGHELRRLHPDGCQRRRRPQHRDRRPVHQPDLHGGPAAGHGRERLRDRLQRRLHLHAQVPRVRERHVRAQRGQLPEHHHVQGRQAALRERLPRRRRDREEQGRLRHRRHDRRRRPRPPHRHGQLPAGSQ